MPYLYTMEDVVLFDGVCNLCNSSVQFIIRHDPGGHFKFSALQSEAGQALLDRFGMDRRKFDSVVLYSNGRYYTHSGAALRIARRLSGLWPLLFYVFYPVPYFIRDAVYLFISRNRYRWFGKQESCMIPTPELRARFL